LPIPILVILTLAGLCLLGWALYKWIPSQRRSDATESIALQKSEVEFEKLTRAEVDEKLKEEVTEASPVPSIEAAPSSAKIERLTEQSNSPRSPDGASGSGANADAAKTPDASAPHDGQKAAEDPRERSRQLIAQLRETEDQVAQLFQNAFEGPFNVKREVKITSGIARGRVLDILLDPDSEVRAQLGIEIKRFKSHVLPDRLSDYLIRVAIASQDLSAGRVFTGARGRPREAKASGVLVLVINREGFAANAFRIQRHVPAINSVLKRPVGVLLITPERLNRIQPGELRDAVASVWAEPGEIGSLE
jgi:hypothetical protein